MTVRPGTENARHELERLLDPDSVDGWSVARPEYPGEVWLHAHGAEVLALIDAADATVENAQMVCDEEIALADALVPFFAAARSGGQEAE